MSNTWLIVVLLIAFNGLLSLAELAVLTARKSRLREAAKDSRGARAAHELAMRPDRFLSAVQVWITLIAMLIGYFGGESFGAEAEHEFAKIELLAPYAHWLGFAASVLMILFVSVLFGELLPKRIAIMYPERLATALAIPMQFAVAAAKPAAHVLSALCDAILKLLRLHGSDASRVTEEEIRMLVAEGEEQGVIDESERRMVNRVLTLGDRTVASVMTPRPRIAWLDIAQPQEWNLRLMQDQPYSRYPVLRGTDADVVGVIEIKDLMRDVIAGLPVALFKHVHTPLFVPESAPALAVLEQFRDASVPLALVVDEYGGIQGLITPNDVLMTVLGRISHSVEMEKAKVVERTDGSWLVDGSLATDDFKELLSIDELPLEDDQEYRSAAGMVIAQFGRIPAAGEFFDWRGYRIEVVDLDGVRVDKILVTRL